MAWMGMDRTGRAAANGVAGRKMRRAAPMATTAAVLVTMGLGCAAETTPAPAPIEDPIEDEYAAQLEGLAADFGGKTDIFGNVNRGICNGYRMVFGSWAQRAGEFIDEKNLGLTYVVGYTQRTEEGPVGREIVFFLREPRIMVTSYRGADVMITPDLERPVGYSSVVFNAREPADYVGPRFVLGASLSADDAARASGALMFIVNALDGSMMGGNFGFLGDALGGGGDQSGTLAGMVQGFAEGDDERAAFYFERGTGFSLLREGGLPDHAFGIGIGANGDQADRLAELLGTPGEGSLNEVLFDYDQTGAAFEQLKAKRGWFNYPIFNDAVYNCDPSDEACAIEFEPFNFLPDLQAGALMATAICELTDGCSFTGAPAAAAAAVIYGALNQANRECE